jgi:hypothetical protein
MNTLLNAVLCIHLLAMACFISAYFVQRSTAPGGRLVSLWPWSVLAITVSGFGLVLINIFGTDTLSPLKMSVKGGLMTILGIAVLVAYFRHSKASNTTVNIFGGLLLCEVVAAVMIP